MPIISSIRTATDTSYGGCIGPGGSIRRSRGDTTMPSVLISKMARADKAKTELSRVLIADEFPLVCEALADKVDATEDLVSCGRAEDAEGVIGAIEELQPDALVLSLHLPNAIGFELIRKIRLTHPELPILVFATHSNSTQAAQALRAGAKGYISKRENAETIIAAIRHVLTGKIWVNKDFMPNLLDRYFGKELTHANIRDLLTKRELQIFEMIGKGVTTREIADLLFISQRTVESHRDHIKTKLGVDDIFKLHQMAFEWVHEELSLRP